MKHNISLTEFGFLFAIFTAPWGPVIRYLGWLFAIIGLALDFKRGRSFRRLLDPWISWPLLLLILATLFSTSIFRYDLETWGRGVSIVLEFSFAIWLAAYVFQETGAVERWKKVWLAGIVLSLIHYFAGEVSLLPKQLFSNSNTTGIYAFIILPFVLALYFESVSKGKEYFHGILFFICLFFLLTSFTSSAWIGAFVTIFMQFSVTNFQIKKLKILVLLSLLFVVISVLVLRLGININGSNIMTMFSRELNQLFSVHDLDTFTTHRIHIWKGSWEMLKAKPLTGWGWGNFPDLFANFHSETWDEAATGLKVTVFSAHSMYFNLGVYGGIPAIVIVLWIYVKSALNSLRSCRRRVFQCYLNCAIFSLVVGQLVYGIGGDMFSFRSKGAILFWTLLGIAGMRRQPAMEDIHQAESENISANFLKNQKPGN